MKKKYSKPDVCCVNSETGMMVSTSEAFAGKTKEMIRLLKNDSGNMEESFAYGREISGKS